MLPNECTTLLKERDAQLLLAVLMMLLMITCAKNPAPKTSFDSGLSFHVLGQAEMFLSVPWDQVNAVATAGASGFFSNAMFNDLNKTQDLLWTNALGFSGDALFVGLQTGTYVGYARTGVTKKKIPKRPMYLSRVNVGISGRFDYVNSTDPITGQITGTPSNRVPTFDPTSTTVFHASFLVFLDCFNDFMFPLLSGTSLRCVRLLWFMRTMLRFMVSG